MSDIETSTVLSEFMETFLEVAQHLETALSRETVDSFHEHSEKALKELEKLIKYVEDNPKAVSAALGRPELKRAQKELGKTLTIIEEAVDTLANPWEREPLYLTINAARNRLKGPPRW